jgi:beta-glucuronidase
MLRETIQRDWNRAGLIIWSVSNECAGENNGEADSNYGYWYEAVPLVRSLDPSRLVSSADSAHRRTTSNGWTPASADVFSEGGPAERWIPGHPDRFYDLLDVLGGNVYVTAPGLGRSYYERYVDMLRPYNKPLMVTEFGSMSVADADGPEDALGHPARHATILLEAYESFADLPEIVGYTPWCLMDVRVPMHWRWYNRGQAVFRYGLLDQNWREKPVFKVVKDAIATLKKMLG